MPLALKRTPHWIAPCLLYGCWTTAASAESSLDPVPSVSGGLEYFHLQELNTGGARLLAETGYRYVIRATLDSAGRYDPVARLLYHLELAGYAGPVDYDGQSQSIDPHQNNLPFSTTTHYQGVRAEAVGGVRLTPETMSRSLDLIGGLGADTWRRQIDSGTTAAGTAVSGVEEIYQVVYAKAGLGMSDLWSGRWHNYLQAGLKLPIKVNEDVNLRAVGYDRNLSLSPGNAYSGFAELTLEAPADGTCGNLLLSLYYQGLRFDPSPSKLASRGNTVVSVWQPETHIDVFGLQLGYRF